MKQHKHETGYTLIELMLYVSLSAGIMLAVSTLLMTLLDARIKTQTVAEVDQQGLQIIQRLTRAVRNAESIVTPAPGMQSDQLVLDPAGSDNSLAFTVTDGTVHMTDDTGTPVPLSNTLVQATLFAVTNASPSDTPGTIQIELTLSYRQESQRQPYVYTKTFLSSATLRM